MKEILEKSLLQKVERLDAFEERLGIQIENISLRIHPPANWFNIFCEVHPVKGTTINERIYIECIIYDTEGAILVKNSKTIYEDDFFGFEVIDFMFINEDLIDKIGKIRIYPKK